MHLEKVLLGSLLGLAIPAIARIIATDEVPLIGPSFISNFDPSNSKAIGNAKKTFPGLIDQLFESGKLNRTDLAFTIDVYSAATNDSIFKYSHVGKSMEKSLTTGELNDDTISRIGSVTKMFTVYAIIAKAGMGVFSDPVTKYLPDLKSTSNSSTRSPLDGLDWEDITVGALAEQQAGTGGIADFFLDYLDEKNPTEYKVEDLLTFFREKRLPVIAPYHSAIYSDGGYAILGQVLAKIAGKSVADAFKDILWQPLGMNSTSTTVPKGSDINAMDRSRLESGSMTSWGLDLDIVSSTGSIYSSTADLRKAGLSILNSELLSGPTTSQWMKPRSGTGSLVELVGAPWEISRLETPVTPGSNRTRISDVYTKAGGNLDYTAIFALSPDQGIGFSILVGGATATPARWPLRDIVGETFIPAAEHAAAENAYRNLAGTFVDESGSGSNITLTVDRGHPGLGLKSLWLNGKNNRNGTHYRLFPTGLNSISKSLSSLYQSEGSIRIAHRSVSPMLPIESRADVEGGHGGLFDKSFTWMDVDSQGGQDLFVLNLENGKVNSVEYPLLEIVMKRAQ